MMADHFSSAVSGELLTPLGPCQIGYSATFSVLQPVQTFIYDMTCWRMFPDI